MVDLTDQTLDATSLQQVDSESNMLLAGNRGSTIHLAEPEIKYSDAVKVEPKVSVPDSIPNNGPVAAAEDLSSKRDREDEATCTICLDPWTNSGEHRVASLGCGHLFGKSCIQKWLGERKTCPSCNKVCKRTEIRDIFVSNVVALDSAELVSMRNELQRERKARRKAEEELGKYMMQNQVLQVRGLV